MQRNSESVSELCKRSCEYILSHKAENSEVCTFPLPVLPTDKQLQVSSLSYGAV